MGLRRKDVHAVSVYAKLLILFDPCKKAFWGAVEECSKHYRRIFKRGVSAARTSRKLVITNAHNTHLQLCFEFKFWW